MKYIFFNKITYCRMERDEAYLRDYVFGADKWDYTVKPNLKKSGDKWEDKNFIIEVV